MLLYTLGFGAFAVLAPDLFLIGHAAGADPASFHEIRDVTVVLLRFVAAYCLFDALQMVFVGAIKGAGDTWFVLIATILVSAAGVSVCWFASQWGVLGWWTGLTAWVWMLGVVFSLRFLQGRWRSMRVIETDPLNLPRET